MAKNLEIGLKKNEFFYLILLRLIPSPFVIQNAITVFFKINLKNFIFSTFLGILPWSIVYCTIGTGLHDLIETTDGLTFNDLFIFKINIFINNNAAPTAQTMMVNIALS